MTITEIAIKRPTLVVVLFTVLGVLGIFGYNKLNYELLPKMAPPVFTISTIYPGASPAEVENSVTKVIEDAISGLEKINIIRSQSYEGRSLIIVEFEQSVDINIALQDAQRKVNQVEMLLPKDILKPTVDKIALDEIPVLRMGVSSNLDNKTFYQFVKDKIQPRLAKVEGVGQIALVGGNEREIKINLNQDKLSALGINISQIAGVIKASNMEIPTGKVKTADAQYVVRLTGKFDELEQIKNLVVGHSPSGGQIKLIDVAEIQDGIKDVSNISRVNGQESIGILILKQSDGNTVEVSKKVRAALKEIETDYSDIGVEFTISQDSSDFTIEAADSVKHDLVLAVILVALVMLIFLHSLRNSFIVMIAIPASLISTFLMMYIFDFTLNLMTLLAMSLVIGILVDDSIVVLENIYRFLEKGEDKVTASIKGRNEIGFAAISITLVDVVVFVPLAVVSGIIGNILREFSLVMVTSTLLSLLVSFTITPAMASRMAKLEHLGQGGLMSKFGAWFESLQDKLVANYKLLLYWSLRHKFVVISISFLLFIGSFALVGAGFIGGEFISVSDRGEFSIQIELEPGASLERTNLVTLQIEQILSEYEEVERVFSNVGVAAEGFIGVTSNNTAEINVALVAREKRSRATDVIQNDIKSKVTNIPDAKVRVSPIGIFGTADESPIQILISGTDYDDVFKVASKLKEVASNTPGATDIRLTADDGKPETKVNIDRDKMASFGLTIAEVGMALRIALTGDDDTKFREDETEYAMRIQLDEFDRSSIDNLKRLTFVNAVGQKVELQQFANLERTNGPTKLQRQNRNRAILMQGNVSGRPSGNIVSDVQAEMANYEMPKGVTVSYEGDQKAMMESFESLMIALGAAILFVYLIMVALYNSYLYPFVVLFSIPVAVIGALLALALTMNTLNVFSFLGLIMLVGLVNKNAILLVDRINQMRDEGLPLIDAIIEAGETRLRPILMTTVAMVFGMLPIAIASGAGSEWKNGLAWALIGGLTSSMFLTLVLIPSVYLLFENIKVKLSKLFNKKEKIAQVSSM